MTHVIMEYEKEIECYDKVLKIDPNDVSAITNKGLALDNLGRYEEAIFYYNKALEIMPNLHGAVYYKRNAHDIFGKTPRGQ